MLEGLNAPLVGILSALRTAITIAPVVFLAALTGWLVYARFFHPLAKVPGPFLASVSRVWFVRHIAKGNLQDDMRKWHEQYGPIVRIAPTEVSISDPAAGQIIYGTRSKFVKSDFYSAWAVDNFDTKHQKLFSDVDEAHAGNRRRLTLSAYSMSSVLEAETYIDQYTILFLSKMTDFSKNGETFNLNSWFGMYALDVIGDLFFGCSFGHLETGTDVKGWLAATERFVAFITLNASLPNWMRPFHGIWTMLTDPEFKGTIGATGVIRDVAQEQVDKREKFLVDGGEKGTERRDLLAKFFELERTRGEKESWRAPDIAQEGFVALFAGGDTTAIAMSSVVYGLMRYPDEMQTLITELRQAYAEGKITLPVRYSDSIKLPFMTACIKEGLRIHPSVGMQMSRMVPAGGCEVAGYYIPEGMRVGMNANVTHFDAGVFGDNPSEFRPRRWLEGDAGNMDRHMLHFGGGTRTCIGKNIALAEVHKLLPHFLLEFEPHLAGPDKPVTSDGLWFNKQQNLFVKVRKR